MIINNELQINFERICADPIQHSRWLNTLSFWENCGARKLAACQHPTKVKEEMLKHAAEEFRHAHYFKRQIHRLQAPYLTGYDLPSLIGGIRAYHYLDYLDIAISRLLYVEGYAGQERYALSYLLVTYAIEKRAEEVYTQYHDRLKQTRSPIRVYPILVEEKEHLAEIIEELSQWPNAASLSSQACCLETKIFSRWLEIIHL